jgi:ankyrin repeat protein
MPKTTASRLNQCMATVQVLLDHGFKVNTTDYDGISLLAGSIANGQSALTKMLLKDGADVNAVGKNGITPLISALMLGGQVPDTYYFAVLNELLAKGAEPNLEIDNQGGDEAVQSSALKMAICWFCTPEAKQKTVTLLMAHGASFPAPKGSDAEQMLLAATNGDTARVAQLLAKGVSPNVSDTKGWTPLLSAAAMEHDAIFKMLVNAGANVKAQDAIGLNALSFAMERYPDLTNAHLLIEKGADLNADSNFAFYNPPLYTAIQQDDPVLLADLLKHGASPNLLPGNHPHRFEPLELAVQQLMEKSDDPKRREIVTELIAAGANRHPKQEGYRVSLLYFPVENNRIDMVKFLLNAGVDPKKDMDGGKALSDTLERHGSKEMKALMGPLLGKT